jgi:hypothetical protein
MGQAAAIARLREDLQDVVSSLGGDAGRVRGAQPAYAQELVAQATAMLDTITSNGSGGEEEEPSPGRRAAIRHGSDPDDGQDRDDPSPGQRAAARAHAAGRDGAGRSRGSAGEAFDRLGGGGF